MENLLQYNDGNISFNLLVYSFDDKFYVNLDEDLANKLEMRNFYNKDEGFMILNKDEYLAFKTKLEKNYVSNNEIEKPQYKTLSEIKKIANLNYGYNSDSLSKGKNIKELNPHIVSAVKNIS